MKKIALGFMLLFLILGFAGARTLVVGSERGNYASLQRALDTASDGDVISITAGTYEVDVPVRVSGKRNLFIEAESGAELVSQSIYEDILVFEDCTNVTLSGLSAYHAETEDCSGYVLVLSGCKNITVEYCYLAGSGSVGIDINYSTNITIDGNSIYDNSWAGVNIGEENKGIYIGYNDFFGNYQNVLIEGEDYSEFEGNTGPVTMEYNTFDYYDDMDPGYYDDYGLYYPEETAQDFYFDDVVFSDFYNDKENVSGRTLTVGKTGGQYNSIQRAIDQARNGDTVRILAGEYTFDDTIQIKGKKNITIEGVDYVELILTDSSENVLTLENSGDIIIRNISARHQDSGCWAAVVYIYHVRSVVLENCELNGSGQVGIDLEGRCDELTVRDCYIHDNSVYAGYIYLYTGSLTFENNLVEYNGGPLEIHDDDYYFTIYDTEDLELIDEALGLEDRGFHFSGNEFYFNRGEYYGEGGMGSYEEDGGQ